MSLSSGFTRFTFDPFVTLKNSPSLALLKHDKKNQQPLNISSAGSDLHAGEARMAHASSGTSVRTLQATRFRVRPRRSQPDRTGPVGPVRSQQCSFLPVPRLDTHQEHPGKTAQRNS